MEEDDGDGDEGADVVLVVEVIDGGVQLSTSIAAERVSSSTTSGFLRGRICCCCWWWCWNDIVLICSFAARYGAIFDFFFPIKISNVSVVSTLSVLQILIFGVDAHTTFFFKNVIFRHLFRSF